MVANMSEGNIWNEMASRAHAISKSKGWWDDWPDPTQRPLDGLCGLLSSEVAELYRACTPEVGDMVGDNASEKLDGFAKAEEEIADIAIRLGDLICSQGHNLDVAMHRADAYYLEIWSQQSEKYPWPTRFGDICSDLNCNIAAILEAWRRGESIADPCGRLLWKIKLYSEGCSWRLLAAIDAKMTYNAKREKRHGGLKS